MTISPLRLALFLLLTGLLAWVAYDRQRDQLVTARRDLSDTQIQLERELEKARLTGQQLATRNQIDAERTEALNHVRAENLRLQRAVADRNQRLLIRASCSAVVPATAGSTGLDDANTAELAADARSDYFTLRDELALAREMILGLQDYIRRVVQGTPAQP
ncbi:lysis protein [Pseudomonas asturiensis]|uniref:Lysis protein n=1 Tax=Pseudomonas asturiensis TaxID=1190415 RepID=A0ABX6H6Z4_9PSED|nr:lysis system i-spanin subunit Rz [Pseudomonas asturiensis]QHF01229.1 lysis protein [Pseudomonas asturiensis]